MVVRIAICMAFLSNAAAFAQSIFTIAGGGTDDGRPATVASLRFPKTVAVDRSGNIYVADTDSHRIRKITASTGIITTVAGTDSRGFSGDGGPSFAASLAFPSAVVLDRSDNLYIADTFNDRIRKITATTGVITTVAGGGLEFPGDGGPATDATLRFPAGVAVDSSGNLYIAESYRLIRRVDVTTGMITTVAGSGLEGFSGDGGPATKARLRSPFGMALDASGNLYIADAANDRIRKVTAATGIITTFAGSGAPGFSGDGGAPTAASLNYPMRVAFDGSGNLYIADAGNNRIRKISAATGVITTVAGGGNALGDGGSAVLAMLNDPEGLALDGGGNLYIADTRNTRVRKVIISSGIISTVAGNDARGFFGDGGMATGALLDSPEGLALDGSGNLYIADRDNSRVRKVAAITGIMTTVAGGGEIRGDGGPATAARLSEPLGVAVDEFGDLYIADGSEHRVRKVVAATGIITTVAGTGAPRFDGDGGPASAASIWRPSGVALDGFRNLYIADYFSNRIRKVSAATGIISTVAGNGSSGFFGDGGPATAASLNMPTGVALDSSANLYVVDNQSARIRKVTAATGIITTVAGGGNLLDGDGGPATGARLAYPKAAALDRAGNLFIANTFDNRVQKVTTSIGIITTVAGGGRAFGDAGPSTAATLSRPSGVALDTAGNLYIADTEANRVRVVFACANVGSPKLTAPAADSAGVSTSPRVAWNAGLGAFRYDVLLDTVSPPQNVAASDVSTTAYAPSNLQPLTTYYWRVIAKGDPFCVPFSQRDSEIRSFTTTATCDAPGAFGAKP